MELEKMRASLYEECVDNDDDIENVFEMISFEIRKRFSKEDVKQIKEDFDEIVTNEDHPLYNEISELIENYYDFNLFVDRGFQHLIVI